MIQGRRDTLGIQVCFDYELRDNKNDKDFVTGQMNNLRNAMCAPSSGG